MFYFQHEGIEFRVRFRHDLAEEGVIPRQNGKVATYKGKTMVLVEQKVWNDASGPRSPDEKPIWFLIAEAAGFRSTSDKNFDRRLGRQAALKRLVFERSDLSRSFKREMFGSIYDA